MIQSAATAFLEAMATEEQKKIRTRLVGNKFRRVPDDDEPSNTIRITDTGPTTLSLRDVLDNIALAKELWNTYKPHE
jgi:hypothetical protein